MFGAKVLYKRYIRLLSCAHPFPHSPLLDSQLGLLIFDDLFPFYSAVFMFKLAKNLLQFVISSMFVRLGGKTRRNVCDYFLPRVQLGVCKKLISFSCVQSWLLLPNELKCLTNYHFSSILA